ncbi:hypothetical protein F1559_002781 [Cyanidiococcus yangmingshanensis]|uniref:Uncharacterized protein n=1 Tax=Cyanidiococcus yangmingshanensis TaxID=2690220 RepID=A0A7J7IH81_9RHOD|nr:hypothetical protein F1559_002781 [Cyanidiococcus yangmingshanensis]
MSDPSSEQAHVQMNGRRGLLGASRPVTGTLERRRGGTAPSSPTRAEANDTSALESQPGSWAALVKARPRSIALWLKYAEHEAREHGVDAARNILGQALRTRDLYRQPELWRALITRYQPSHRAALKRARQAVQLLPRCAELWELYTNVRYFPHEWASWPDVVPSATGRLATETVPLSSHFEGEWLATLTRFKANLNEKEHVYECWAALEQKRRSYAAQQSSLGDHSNHHAILSVSEQAVSADETAEDVPATILLRGARLLTSARLWRLYLERALLHDHGHDQAMLEEALQCIPKFRSNPWFQAVLRERREQWARRFDTEQLIKHVERFPLDGDAWLMLAKHYFRERNDEAQSDEILMTFMRQGLHLASGGEVGRFMAEFLARTWWRTRSLEQARNLTETALRVVRERSARDAVYCESLRFERYTLEDQERCRVLFERWLTEAPHLASVWAAWAQFERECGAYTRAVSILQVACDYFHAVLTATNPSRSEAHRRRQVLQILALWRLRMESVLDSCMGPVERRRLLLPLYSTLLQRYPDSLAVATSYAAFEAFTDDCGLDQALEFLRQKRLDQPWSTREQARLETFITALRQTHAAFSRNKRARLWRATNEASTVRLDAHSQQ